MVTSTSSIRLRLQRAILITLVVLTLLQLAIVGVLAGSYSINSQGDCYSGYPKAASWLNWSGMPSNSNGQTNAVLAYYTGTGSWVDMSNGASIQYGSENNAIVHTHSQNPWRFRNWQQRSSHAASFFNGVTYRYYDFTC